MVDYPGCFAWYELMTTNMAGAETFYGNVVGWRAQDASTPNLAYKLLSAGKVPLGGLIDLPEEGRRMGAWPRWMGYVEVNDVEATADRIKRLGGTVHVPPTNTNIGLIAVVADPQTATFGLVKGLKPGRQQPAESGKPGRVGWHELRAADWEKAFAFYGEIFGWQKTQRRNQPDSHISIVFLRRFDARRHVHQASRRTDPVLAVLLQCRGHRCGSGACQGWGRARFGRYA